jgi:hypothetical protein
MRWDILDTAAHKRPPEGAALDSVPLRPRRGAQKRFSGK